MKNTKKVIATVITASMLASATMPAFAANMMDANTVNYGIPVAVAETANNLVDLDKYMSYNEDNTIAFDTVAALNAGYNADAVAEVNSNILMMNQMVQEGKAVPSENFSVTSYGMSTRAVGESKIVTHWDGRVDYYLNSEEALVLQSSLQEGYSIAEAAAKAVAKLGKGTPLASMGAVMTIYTKAMKKQIEMAISHGTGIIMTTQPDPTTGMLYTWFTYQD